MIVENRQLYFVCEKLRQYQFFACNRMSCVINSPQFAQRHTRVGEKSTGGMLTVWRDPSLKQI